jgi:hypothetical protein
MLHFLIVLLQSILNPAPKIFIMALTQLDGFSTAQYLCWFNENKAYEVKI